MSEAAVAGISPLPDPVLAGPFDPLVNKGIRPVLKFMEGRDWELVETVVYRDWDHKITIPGGFLFDLSSIPRLMWLFIAPIDLHVLPPLLHDWLYRNGGTLGLDPAEPPYKRADADRLFNEVMRFEGVKPFKRRAAYTAVRLFGWWAWRKDSKS